jgi:hypothetical protein
MGEDERRTEVSAQKRGLGQPKPLLEPWKLFMDSQRGGANTAQGAELGAKGGRTQHRIGKSLKLSAMRAVAPLAVMGLSQSKIGMTLGLTRDQVYLLMASREFPPIVEEYRQSMYSQAEQALTSALPYAIWTLFDLLSAKSDYVREKAAADLLANGKILERMGATRPGDEQRELLKAAAEKDAKPRIAMTVVINNNRLTVKKSKAAPMLIEGVAAELVEAPDDEDGDDQDGGDDAQGDDEVEETPASESPTG